MASVLFGYAGSATLSEVTSRKNLGIGKNAVLAWRLHGGNNRIRARAMFPPTLPLRVNALAILILATVVILLSTRLVVMAKPPRAFATRRRDEAAGVGAM